MKGLGKRSIYGLREHFDLPPRGKIDLKPFSALKDVWGRQATGKWTCNLQGAKRVVMKLQEEGCVSFCRKTIDTENDRAKVPPYNGNDPRRPLVV